MYFKNIFIISTFPLFSFGIGEMVQAALTWVLDMGYRTYIFSEESVKHNFFPINDAIASFSTAILPCWLTSFENPVEGAKWDIYI